MNNEITQIIRTANELISEGSTGGCTSEQIAAAFVLNQLCFIPAGYDMIQAWERIEAWQGYVKIIKSHYMHLINR
jgi:hypothetical protein